MGITLDDQSRVGVIGGGPTGALFAYFALTFAGRAGLQFGVDIYEPRDFPKPGPAGCNMRGGIVSKSLVQAHAIDGVALPPAVVQREIQSYVLHRVTIDTPSGEKRIAAVHRGRGPARRPRVKETAGMYEGARRSSDPADTLRHRRRASS